MSSSIVAVFQQFSGFNCLLPFSSSIVSCTSGLLRLQLSSSIFSSSIVTLFPNYSGYNCILRFFKLQIQRLFFSEFFDLLINIYLLSLSNSLSIKNLAKSLILKIAILSSKSSKLIATSTF
jgi:hypothetical protein